MPPEEEKQPSESEKLILQWLNSQLTGKAANAEEKLERLSMAMSLSTKTFLWRVRGCRGTFLTGMDDQ